MRRSQRGTGENRAGNLRTFPAGQVAIPDSQNPDGKRHTHAGRQKGMGQGGGGIHPHKREVQGRCAPAEGLYGGFPLQKEKSERGRSAAVLCGGKPRSHHIARRFRQCAGADAVTGQGEQPE